MREKTFTLIILHIAVFLAGWTGIFLIVLSVVLQTYSVVVKK